MEVIVDDSQLSLAIGKKGQNVRLAAKLLGWRIDIKSEEEKRQEVESAMAALVAPGAPVSILIDYGMTESLAEKLLEAGIATVEKLGSMTPEELEEIQGVGPKMVEKIQEAVNAYYAQFDGTAEGAEAGEELAAEAPVEEQQAPPEMAVEAVDSEDTVVAEAVESDTMEDITPSAHSLDEKGEIRES
jgi:N utilization substance protein A